MFACSLAFMLFILALLDAGVPVGLGVAVTTVLVLEFVLSAVVQAATKVVAESKSRKTIVRRIEVPPV
jgi:hypothetical protein